MMEYWINGIMGFKTHCSKFSFIPAFQYSILPSFQSSNIPLFQSAMNLSHFSVRTHHTDALIDHVELDDPVLLRVANNSQRLPPFSHPVDLFVQKLSKENYPFVAHAEMLLRSIRDRPLGFPRHRILHQHMLEAILAFLISDRKVFPRRVAIRRRAISVNGRKINNEHLCMRIVHGHAYLHIMAQSATKQFLSEHMAQSVRK